MSRIVLSRIEAQPQSRQSIQARVNILRLGREIRWVNQSINRLCIAPEQFLFYVFIDRMLPDPGR